MVRLWYGWLYQTTKNMEQTIYYITRILMWSAEITLLIVAFTEAKEIVNKRDWL